jgi:tetratricopeptide (TPR) repeat protein
MGYSGSDDFDIAPMLRQLFDLKRLVWIEHSDTDSTEIIEFDPKKSFSIPEDLSRSEQLLAQISSNTEAQVIMVKTNTHKFIQEIIWNKIFPEELLVETKAYLQAAIQSIIPLDEWLSQKFTRIPIELKWKTTADLYYELGYHTDFLRTAQKGLEIANEANSPKFQSEFLNLLGIYYFSQKKYDLALQYYQDSLKKAENIGFGYLKGSRINNIGLVYFEMQDYTQALKYFEDALQLGLQRGDNIGVAARLGNIGQIYLAQREYEKAKENFEKAYKIDEKIGNLIGRSIRLKNFGDLFKAKKDTVNALEYYQKAYRILQKLGDLRRTGQILIHISNVQIDIGEFSKALMNIQTAVKYFKGAEDPILLQEAQAILAEIKANLQ